MVNNESNSSLREPSFEESAFFKQAMERSKEAEDQAFIDQYVRPKGEKADETDIGFKVLDSEAQSLEVGSKDIGSVESNLEELMFDLPDRYDSELLNTSFYFSTNDKAKNRLETNAKMFDKVDIPKENSQTGNNQVKDNKNQIITKKPIQIAEEKPKAAAESKITSIANTNNAPNSRLSITSLYIDSTKSIEPEPPIQPLVVEDDNKDFEDLRELSDIHSVLDFSFDVKNKNGRRLSDIVKEERFNLESKSFQLSNDENPIKEIGMAIFDNPDFSKRRSLSKENISKRGKRLSEKLKAIVEENSDFDTMVTQKQITPADQQDSRIDNRKSQISNVISNMNNREPMQIIEESMVITSQDNLLISSSPLTKTFCETSMFNDDILYSSPSKVLNNNSLIIENDMEKRKEQLQAENKQMHDNITVEEKPLPNFLPLQLEKEVKKVNVKASNLSKVQKVLLQDQENEVDFFHNRKNELSKKIVEEHNESVRSPPRSPIRTARSEADRTGIQESIKKTQGVDPQFRDMIMLSSSKKPAKKTQQFATLVKNREYQELLNKTNIAPEKTNEHNRPVDHLTVIQKKIEKLHTDINNTLESRKEDVEFLRKVTEGFGFDKKTRENELKRLMQLKINHSLLLSSKVALNKDLQTVLADKASQITFDVPRKPLKQTGTHILERLFNISLVRAEQTPKGVEYTLRYRHSFIIFARCRGDTKKLKFLQMYFLEGQKQNEDRKTKLSEVFVKFYEKRIAQTQCKELYDAIGYICKLHDSYFEVIEESDKLVNNKQIESYTMDKECIFSYIVKPHKLPLMTLSFKLSSADNCTWHLSYTILEENKKLNTIFDKSFKDAFTDLNKYIQTIFSKDRMSIGSKIVNIFKKVNSFSLASFKSVKRRDLSVDQSNSKYSANKPVD